MNSKTTPEEEKDKQVVHYVVGKICKEQEEETGILFSKEAVASLTEVCIKQFSLFAEDLELFTKHARRKKVSPDDILMLVRRTPMLHKHLSNMKSEERSSTNQ